MTSPITPPPELVMDDHFVHFHKKVLSPGAKAVLRAVQFKVNAECHAPWIAAAALRAVADQVASPIPDDCRSDVFNRQLDIRAHILAIATELKAQP